MKTYSVKTGTSRYEDFEFSAPEYMSIEDVGQYIKDNIHRFQNMEITEIKNAPR